MYIEFLKSGASVQIQRPMDDPKGGFMCKIAVALTERREVLVHAPKQEGKSVPLELGAKLNLRLLTENAIYSFGATMLAFTDVDGFEVVRIRINDGGEKIQRRSAFRFNCSIPVAFSIIYTNGQKAARGEGIITDLSAGGAKIFTNENLQVGYLLSIELPIGKDLVIAFGDVRSRMELPPKSKYHHQYGVRFSMMPESDQEIIIRFMYKMQREDLKRVRPR